MTEVLVALKDLRAAVRSRFFIGMAVVVPLLVTALFYFAFGGAARSRRGPGIEPVRLAVANFDQPAGLGRAVVGALSGPRLNQLLSITNYTDTAQARQDLAANRTDAILVIPSGFSAAIFGETAHAEVVLAVDPTRTIKPGIAQAVIEQVLDGFSGSNIAVAVYRAFASDQGPVGVRRLAAGYQLLAGSGAEPVAVRAPESGEDPAAMFRRVMAATFSGLMVFFAFYTAAYTALSVVREDEQGTLARLFTVPISRSRILGGKLLSVIITVVLQGVVLIGASTLLFGLRWGRVSTSALAFAGMVAATAGFGVMLASFIRRTRQAGPVLGGGLSVAGMLGGLFTQSVPSMPAAFNRIALFLPQGWVMRGWRLAIAGGQPADLVLPLVVMVGMGTACFIVGVLVFRRRFG